MRCVDTRRNTMRCTYALLFFAPVLCFGTEEALLNTDATTDTDKHDWRIHADTNQQGLWHAIWYRTKPDNTISILKAKSTDNGYTWNTPTVLSQNSIADAKHTSPKIATDKQGLWVATWMTNDNQQGRKTSYNIAIRTSTNNGETWTKTKIIGTNSCKDPDIKIHNGTILIAWDYWDGNKTNIAYRTSTNGSTWSNTTIFNHDGDDSNVNIEAHNSTWAITWSKTYTIGSYKQSDIFLTHSTDLQNWTTPQKINNGKTGQQSYDIYPKIETNGNKWVVIWNGKNTLNNAGTDYDIISTTSTDLQNWTTPTVVNSNGTTDNRSDEDQQIVYNQGIWTAVWSGSNNVDINDMDVYYATSTDGQNWGPRQALKSNTYTDPTWVDDEAPNIFTDGTGWLIAWTSEDNRDNCEADRDLFYTVSTDGQNWNTTPPAPLIAQDDQYTTQEDQSIHNSVLTNDNPEISSRSLVAKRTTLNATLNSPPSHGTLDFHADGTFTYQPDTGYNGQDTFTYTATDGIRISNEATAHITVQPINAIIPTAIIQASLWNIQVGDDVGFDGSHSEDIDGEIIEHLWDFGDGTIMVGEILTHKYNNPGNYEVTLTVTDNEGLTDNDTIIIIVEKTEEGNDKFDIDDGKITPKDTYIVTAKVLGAAIEIPGQYELMVTTRIKIGDEIFECWGDWNNATESNVNDHQVHTWTSDREFDMLPISAQGKSWKKYGQSWRPFITVDSETKPQMVKILKNGDTIPNLLPWNNQSNIEDFIQGFLDLETNTITLNENEAIFLFELGTTDPHSAAADYQDLVVLISLGEPEPTPEPTPEARKPGFKQLKYRTVWDKDNQDQFMLKMIDFDGQNGDQITITVGKNTWTIELGKGNAHKDNNIRAKVTSSNMLMFKCVRGNFEDNLDYRSKKQKKGTMTLPITVNINESTFNYKIDVDYKVKSRKKEEFSIFGKDLRKRRKTNRF